MNTRRVIGYTIPRKKNVNILEDMADIVEAVKGSGMPDEFFSELCCVHDQLHALSQYMNLTAVQVTILAVVAELNDPYVSIADMADYICCSRTALRARETDFLFLEWIGCLSRNLLASERDEYFIPRSLYESWSNNRLYSPFDQNVKEGQALLNRISFKLIQYNKEMIRTGNELKEYIDNQIDRYSSSQILSYMRCATHCCPYPSLGDRVLLMLVSYCVHYEPFNDFAKEKIQGFLCIPEDSYDELDCVLDYLIDSSCLELHEGQYFVPAHSFLRNCGSILMVELPGDGVDDYQEHIEEHIPSIRMNVDC